MRDLYTIGVFVGFGAGVGVLAAALLAGARLGALTRGGARIATAALLVLGALVLGLLALIPGVGYLEAIVLPALALRLRRTGSRRYAGLRILARD